MTEIRLATAEDIPAIAALMKWATEKTLATFTIVPRGAAEWLAKREKSRAFYPWLVAIEPGEDGVTPEVAGFAKAGAFRDNDAYAHTVEVSVYLWPRHHRKGIGRRLYDRLFAILHLQGYHQVVAIVTAENAESIAFHERIGMRNAGTLRRCGFKFDRFAGITFLEIAIQDDQQKPDRILSVADVVDTGA